MRRLSHSTAGLSNVMKKINVLAMAAALLFPHAAAWSQPAGSAQPANTTNQLQGGLQNELSIGIKEQRALAVPADLERIAVGDPEIADIIVLPGNRNQPGNVLLVGKKAGSTSVTAWSRNRIESVWQVHVQSPLLAQLPATDTKLRLSEGNALLRGESPSLLSHAGTAAIAGTATGGKVLDTATIHTGGMVQIDVKIVEFSKNVLKEAGFDFLINTGQGVFSFGLLDGNNQIAPNSATGRYSFASPASQAFNLLNRGGINTRVKLIETSGLARVLAQPSLIALSGHSASFLAGGELPIPQAGGLGTTSVTYKPFGIGVTVTPTVLAANRIVLKVAPEASDISNENGLEVNGIRIPGISTRRAETTLELGDGESFVIGGLVSRDTRSNASKVPLLGDLPIIGTFFRSMQYSQDEKELAIIVTPHLVRPLAKGTQLALPGGDRERIDTPGNAWGAYLLGAGSRDELPGFSK